jgi:hypothetical protein
VGHCGSRVVGSGVRVAVALILWSVAGISLKMVVVLCRAMVGVLNLNTTFWE